MSDEERISLLISQSQSRSTL